MRGMSQREIEEFQRQQRIAEGRYYHGGRGGMAKGQFVLPPSMTGAKSQANYGNNLVDRSRVYVTTDYMAALMYAVTVRDGDVYEVVPDGELLDDPDCSEPGISFSCPRARIVRRLRFTRAERETVRQGLLDAVRSDA